MSKPAHGPVWDRLLAALRQMVRERDFWGDHVGETGCCYCGEPVGEDPEEWLREHINHRRALPSTAKGEP